MSADSSATDDTDRTVGTYEAVLSSELDDSGPFVIHGVALGANDTTIGHLSKTKKVWPSSELEEAAETLEGKPLVKDHENNVDGLIGEVTDAAFKEGVGVIYEAEIDSQYRSIAKKIANGLLDVSPRVKHLPAPRLEKNDDGALIVEKPRFINLSVVTQGASPSNTAEIGESAELTAAELQSAFAGEASGPTFEEDVLGDADASTVADELSGPEQDDTATESADDEESEELSDEDDLEAELEAEVEDLEEDLEEELSDDEGSVETDADVDESESTEADAVDSDGDTEELAGWELHLVDYDGTTTSEWDEPTLSEFVDEMDIEGDVSSFDDLDAEQRATIGEHFFLADGGFPADEFGDLALPAVEPSGELNLSALRTIKGGHGAQAVEGLSTSMEKEVIAIVNELVEVEFDEDWGPTDADELGLTRLRNEVLPAVGVGVKPDLTAEELRPRREVPVIVEGDLVKVADDVDLEIDGKLGEELPDHPYALVRDVRPGDGDPVAKIEFLTRANDGALIPANRTTEVPIADLHAVDHDSSLGAFGPDDGAELADAPLVDLDAGDVVRYDGDVYELSSMVTDEGSFEVALQGIDQPVAVADVDVDVDADIESDESGRGDADSSAVAPAELASIETLSIYDG